MKKSNYVSSKEHKLILITAFVWFGLVAITFIWEIGGFYNEAVSRQQQELALQAGVKPEPAFSISSNPTMPGFHFLSIFILAALYKTKRFIAPLLLTIIYFATFLYGLTVKFDSGQLGGEEFSPEFSLCHKLYYGTSDFDFLAAFFISILLFWQISILLRILIKSLQRKDALP
jgi:hypothetical protein